MMMGTRSEIQLLEILSSELTSLQNNTLSFTKTAELIYKKKYLKLSDKVEKSWDDLRQWMPRRGILPWNKTAKFNQKMPLLDWIVYLMSSFDQTLFDKPQDQFLPVADLQTLEVWVQLEDYYGGHDLDQGGFYWDNLYSCLDIWRRYVDANLETVEWAADAEMINFVMTWTGPFRSIEALELEKVKLALWMVSFQSRHSIALPKVSTALLLITQLVARLGGNLLLPIRLEHQQLTMTLKIPRADKMDAPPSPLPLEETAFTEITDYIIAQILPGYIAASQQLEAVLADEIQRLEAYILKGELEATSVDNLRHVLAELASIRRTFTEALRPD